MVYVPEADVAAFRRFLAEASSRGAEVYDSEIKEKLRTLWLAREDKRAQPLRPDEVSQFEIKVASRALFGPADDKGNPTVDDALIEKYGFFIARTLKLSTAQLLQEVRTELQEVVETPQYVAESVADALRLLGEAFVAPNTLGDATVASLVIDPSTFQFSSYVGAVATLGIDVAAIRKCLTDRFQLAPATVEVYVKLVERVQQAYPARPVLAEFWTELSVLDFADRHWHANDVYEANKDLNDRRSDAYEARQSLSRVEDRAKALGELSPKVLSAVDFKFRDLLAFPNRQSDSDGVDVWEKVDMARWLCGPYARITTPDELREVLSQFTELEYQREHSPPGRGACVTLNPKAWAALKEKGLYTVLLAKPHPRNPYHIDHEFLLYLPPRGERPIVIDYSINQFVGKRIEGPAVTYLDEISEFLKRYDGRGAEYFQGASPRSDWSGGVSFDLIWRLAEKLGVEDRL